MGMTRAALGEADTTISWEDEEMISAQIILTYCGTGDVGGCLANLGTFVDQHNGDVTALATTVLGGITVVYVIYTRGIASAANAQTTVAQIQLKLAYQPYVFVKPMVDQADAARQGALAIRVFNNSPADAFQCIAALGCTWPSGTAWLSARDFQIGLGDHGDDLALFQTAPAPGNEITGAATRDSCYNVVFCQNIYGDCFRCSSGSLKAEPWPEGHVKKQPEWVTWYKDQIKEARLNSDQSISQHVKRLSNPTEAGAVGTTC
jgi:hypothetical protein